MNLPHPFRAAAGLMPNADGSVSLIDAQGKSLAQVPLNTAFELSTNAEGYGYSDFDGSGFGDANTLI